ncbi:MAG TPA: response regulator [Chitinispirillaceae bacterium]|nr:response regulator [Chitinispirillaceae bacterium]
MVSETRSELPLLSGKRILLMDDDPMVQMVVAKLLTKRGCRVECTQSGEETIKKYREFLVDGTPFNLVMMDLSIREGMGGVEAAQLLKKIDPGAKTVIFSGYLSDPVIDEPAKYGFDGVLKKPFSFEEFESLLALFS